MLRIGFSNSSISIASSLCFLTTLLTSVPAGALADRWSRKGVLMLSTASYTATYTVFSISTTPLSYTFGSILWGMSSSLSVGLYDTVLYDTAMEVTQNSDLYEKSYGRYKLYQGIILAITALFSSLVVNLLSMRWTYVLTIPFAILAFAPLCFFKEPKLHKTGRRMRLLDSFKILKVTIKKRRSLILTIGVSTLLACLMNLVYTFKQFWYVELNIPTVFFGVITSITWLSGCGGSLLERHFSKKHHYRRNKIELATAMLICALCLVLLQNIVIVIASQLVFLVCGIVAAIFLSRELHDVFPSDVRASIASAFQAIVCTVSILLTLLFGEASKHSVFSAAKILVIGCALALIYFIKAKPIRIEQV